MSLFSCAYSAVKFFTPEDAVLFVAIGGAESGWDVTAEGDPWYNYRNIDPAYHVFACGDYTSFGWLQINLRWNHDTVAQLSGGITDNCDQKLWLFTVDNCTRTAAYLFARSGPTLWSTYNNGSYRGHLEDAALMVAFAEGPLFGGPPHAGIDPPFAAIAPPAAAVAPPDSEVPPP